jgi:hypothetical protein
MFAIFHSMHGRLFLILLLGMIVTATGTIMLTHSRQQEMYDRVRSQHMATEINQLVETLEKAAPTERENILRSFHSMGIRARPAKDAMLPPITTRDDILEDALQQRSLDAKLIAEQPSPAACGDMEFRRRRHIQGPGPLLCQRVQIILPDGW